MPTIISGVPIEYTGTSGGALAATLQRLSDNYFWDHTAGTWQSAPAFADKKITLTEGSSENAGSYTATVYGLGDAQEVLVRIHDTGDSNATVASGEILVLDGREMQVGDCIYRDVVAAENSMRMFDGATLASSVDDSDSSATGSSFKGGVSLSAIDHFYEGSVLAFCTGNNKPEARKVQNYIGSTRTFQFATAFQHTPEDGDEFLLIGRIQ